MCTSRIGSCDSDADDSRLSVSVPSVVEVDDARWRCGSDTPLSSPDSRIIRGSALGCLRSCSFARSYSCSSCTDAAGFMPRTAFFSAAGSFASGYTFVVALCVSLCSAAANGANRSSSSSDDESRKESWRDSPWRSVEPPPSAAKGMKPSGELSDRGFSRSWKWLDRQSYASLHSNALTLMHFTSNGSAEGMFDVMS